MKIFKYEIPIADSFQLEIPKNGKILSFYIQANVPRLWILIDETEEKILRNFKLFGTGQDMNVDHIEIFKYQFIVTIQKDGFVWHLFEVIN